MLPAIIYAHDVMSLRRNCMKTGFSFVLVLLASVFLISGCDQMPGGKPDIAIMDLAVIAEATGQDEFIRAEAEATRNALAAQLQQFAQVLDQQLTEEAEKAGANPSPEDLQRLQQLNAQARTQMNDAQTQAQTQAAQIEQQLVTEFRDAISPLAEEIAKSQGASAVLAVDAYMFWFDPAIDITDEVIAAWRARPAEEAVVEAAIEEVAEVQAELEAVEGELADTEADLSEAEEQIEVLEEIIEDTEVPAAE
jgi:Skp family chaperone for outer membrane proteins